MSRFFISPECIKGNIALIDGEQAHHVQDVLRLKRGDKITTFDGSGKLYQGKVLETSSEIVKVKIERVQQAPPRANFELTLVQALPKLKKMDYIIEKCTELQVHSIIPIQTVRTIVKLDRKRKALRRARWQRIAREAAKQCARTTIPQVKDLTSLTDVLSVLSGGFDLKLLACLGKKTEKLRDVLQRQNEPEKVAVFIGPEGDFTPEEIHRACDAGCIAVSLGPNVLKSDTAAISALAMINYALTQ